METRRKPTEWHCGPAETRHESMGTHRNPTGMRRGSMEIAEESVKNRRISVDFCRNMEETSVRGSASLVKTYDQQQKTGRAELAFSTSLRRSHDPQWRLVEMDWIKSNRTELLAQAQTYSTGIADVGTTVGLTGPEVTGFEATVGVYSDALTSVEEAKATYDKFYEEFMTEKATLVKLMRKYNNRMQVSAGITNAKRAQIGLPIPANSSTPVVPKTVIGLIATPYANGTVKLKWNRSGNAEVVTFSIEVSDDATTWDYLTAVTKTNIKLTDFAPGVTKYFRIVATRGTLAAVPSETVVIYSGSGGGALSVAA